MLQYCSIRSLQRNKTTQTQGYPVGVVRSKYCNKFFARNEVERRYRLSELSQEHVLPATQRRRVFNTAERARKHKGSDINTRMNVHLLSHSKNAEGKHRLLLLWLQKQRRATSASTEHCGHVPAGMCVGKALRNTEERVRRAEAGMGYRLELLFPQLNRPTFYGALLLFERHEDPNPLCVRRVPSLRKPIPSGNRR